MNIITFIQIKNNVYRLLKSERGNNNADSD